MKKIKLNWSKPIKGWKKLSKKKKIITSAISVVMVCVITTSVVFAARNSNNQLPQAMVQTATVSTGNISNTIVGTGNLVTDDSNTITVPSGITVKKVKVESGDAVSKGDTLATVNTASVLSAIETVQEEIEGLDEEINDFKNSSETETVTAKISGTIKKIYVKAGDDVTECIAENGALLLISPDGDSTEKLEITASGGTVSEIHVSKKETVSANDTLLTITKDEESAEYKQLIAQRKALAASLKKLTSMAKTGKIVADMDGIIGEVNVLEGSESTSSSSGSSSSTTSGTSSKNVSASQTSYSTSGVSMTTLSTVRTDTAVKTATTKTAVKTASVDTTVQTAETTETSTVSATSKIQLKIVNSGDSTKNSLVLSQPETGKTPQSKLNVTDASYEGSIVWNPTDSMFAAGTTYSADVTLTAKEGYIFGIDSILSAYTGVVSGITVSDDGNTLAFKITFPATAEEKSQTTGEKNTQTHQDKDNNEAVTSNYSYDGSTSQGITQSGNSSGKTTSSTVSTQNTTESSDTESESSSYANEVTAFTLASNDSMLLSVNVDELDINSVSKGQEASITMDAIEDKTFTGTVTKVANSATSSSSGVAKYVVEVTIPKDEQMKAGMNASATIVIENKENILTIPVNALQERGDRTFVYTKKDEDGNLSGETEITTGLSDGDNVEITDGLSEGDTVYYQRTGNISNQSGGDMSEMRGNRGDSSNMPEGFDGKGSMPSGMPSGGPGGSQ